MIEQPDFILVTSDSHVDIPINGTAIVHRLLESKGYNVKIVDDVTDENADKKLKHHGIPKLGFLLTSGIMDSTLYAQPGVRAGRKVVGWSKILRKKFPGSKIIVGGLEASIRRLAHYDMFIKKVVPSIMIDMEADILVYGMAERQILEIGERLRKDKSLEGVRGTVWKSKKKVDGKELPSFKEVTADNDRFIDSFNEQIKNIDPYRGKRLIERYDDFWVVQEPSAIPLSPEELDFVNELPYTRKGKKRFPAEISEMQNNTNDEQKQDFSAMMEQAIFSVVTHRGCFGGCNFCTNNFHQGKIITSRTEKSILHEIVQLVKREEFKGTIFLVSPTANMYGMDCKMQGQGQAVVKTNSLIDGKDIEFRYDKTFGCNRSCLPRGCTNLELNFERFRNLLTNIKNIPGVKNVELVGGFVYDLLMKDEKMMEFLLKEGIEIIVAREHTDDEVLRLMNKPSHEEYEKFSRILQRLAEKTGCKPNIRDYIIKNHPGSTAKELEGLEGAEVSEFKALPMTASGVMKHTGKDLKKEEIKKKK